MTRLHGMAAGRAGWNVARASSALDGHCRLLCHHEHASTAIHVETSHRSHAKHIPLFRKLLPCPALLPPCPTCRATPIVIMESAVSCATCGVENDSAAAAHNRTGRLGQLKISTCTHARTMITQPRSNPDTTPKATADMRLRFESCMLRGSSRPAEGFFMAQATYVILKADIQRSKQGGIAIYQGPTCCAVTNVIPAVRKLGQILHGEHLGRIKAQAHRARENENVYWTLDGANQLTDI